FDDRDVEEIMQLRAALEGLAARVAAETNPSGAAEELRLRLRRMMEAATEGDSIAATLAHIDFHRAIGEASEFGRLVGFLDQLAAQSLALWSYAELSPADLAALAGGHEPIIRAIEIG